MNQAYRGREYYLLRAECTLRSCSATQTVRRAVKQAVAEMLAIGSRNGRGRNVEGPPPPVRHIDALAVTERVRSRLCDAAIDMAAGLRGCHCGADQSDRAA